MRRPPGQIETERLVLRRWELEDADAFSELLDSSRDEYAEFIAFFLEGDPHERMRHYRDAFESGESFSFGAWVGGRLVGGGGLFPRVGPGALEVGYHVRSDATGNGYATEIARELVRVAFDVCRARRVELHIDPRNHASVAVAHRVGATHDAGRSKPQLAVYTLLGQLVE